jgi:hypothetical protein
MNFELDKIYNEDCLDTLNRKELVMKNSQLSMVD